MNEKYGNWYRTICVIISLVLCIATFARYAVYQKTSLESMAASTEYAREARETRKAYKEKTAAYRETKESYEKLCRSIDRAVEEAGGTYELRDELLRIVEQMTQEEGGICDD